MAGTAPVVVLGGGAGSGEGGGNGTNGSCTNGSCTNGFSGASARDPAEADRVVLNRPGAARRRGEEEDEE
jgi:hypothetical protein